MIFEKVCALIAEQFNVDADSITMDTSIKSVGDLVRFLQNKID